MDAASFARMTATAAQAEAARAEAIEAAVSAYTKQGLAEGKRVDAEARVRMLTRALRLAASRPTPYAGMWHAPGHDAGPEKCVGCVIEDALARAQEDMP